MPPLVPIAEALAEQREANRSALPHAASFAGHRTRLTEELIARAPVGGGGRLALLGAGNAHDVDLVALASAYAEVHLVDLDTEAVTAARERATAAGVTRLHVHAPVDLSGLLDRLPFWGRVPPAVAALEREVMTAVARVVSRLPGPFDVVASCCLLTQLQLVLLQVIGDRHPRFPELRSLVNAIHARVLAALLPSGGVALLVTDLTSSEMYPLGQLPSGADLGQVMGELVQTGNVITAAHPGLLSSEFLRDPALNQACAVRWPVGPWLWQNGPEQTFLVYALEVRRL